MLIEIGHEHLVLRIAGAGKRHGSGNNLSALGSHASTIVHNQADGDWDIFVAEIFSLLEDSVLVNLKVFFVESRNKHTFVVLHGRVQDHGVSIYPNRVFATPAALQWRGFLRPGDAW